MRFTWPLSVCLLGDRVYALNVEFFLGLVPVVKAGRLFAFGRRNDCKNESPIDTSLGK
jgi:hypothetical protein